MITKVVLDILTGSIKITYNSVYYLILLSENGHSMDRFLDNTPQKQQ